MTWEWVVLLSVWSWLIERAAAARFKEAKTVLPSGILVAIDRIDKLEKFAEETKKSLSQQNLAQSLRGQR